MPHPNPSIPMLQHGSFVRACDCTLRGRINMVYATSRGRFFRVQFPPRSPFFDDWTLYAESELAPWQERPKLIDIVAIMRPKLPRHTRPKT